MTLHSTFCFSFLYRLFDFYKILEIEGLQHLYWGYHMSENILSRGELVLID